eukprot:scpid106164/ scgid9598/ 
MMSSGQLFSLLMMSSGQLFSVLMMSSGQLFSVLMMSSGQLFSLLVETKCYPCCAAAESFPVVHAHAHTATRGTVITCGVRAALLCSLPRHDAYLTSSSVRLGACAHVCVCLCLCIHVCV